MGQIREELVLADQFSASFSRFIAQGEAAAGKMGQLGQTVQNAGTSSAGIFRKMESGIQTLGRAANYLSATGFEQMDQELARINEKMDLLGKSSNYINASGFEQVNRTLKEMGESSRYVAVQGMNEINQTLKEIAASADRAGRAQQEYRKQVEGTTLSARLLLSVAGRIAAAFGGMKLAGGLVGLSDTVTQTSARLELMAGQVDGGIRNVQELENAIYASAGRARGAYQETADAVAKLGLMAGNAFSSSDEIIYFMEQINKQFKIAGTEASGIRAAMLQLTQAMGSGVLRGEEYNSILEQAPNIVQNIAKYIEGNEQALAAAAGAIRVSTEDLSGNVQRHMKDIASAGVISADLVKAAMFAAADETDRKFASIPMTYADAWQQIRNAGVSALGDVADRMNDFLNTDTGQWFVEELVAGMELLAEVASVTVGLMAAGADFVRENWDFVLPVLMGIGAGFLAAGAAGVASGLAAAAAWAAANAPFIAIGVTVGTLLFLLHQSGVSWQEMGAVAGGVLGALYTVFYTTVAFGWNLFASFAEFFANVFNDPVAAIAHLFADLLDTILGVVETAASAIDALLGSNLSGAVSGFRGKVADWVDTNYGANAVEIKRMASLDAGDTVGSWAEMGGNLGSKLDAMDRSVVSLADSFKSNLGASFAGTGGGGISGGTGGIGNIGKVGSVGSVKNVDGEISLADEDVRLYRDLAERRYMNQIELKTLAPNINIAMPAGTSGDLSAQDVADHVKRILIEQMSAQTSVAHG